MDVDFSGSKMEIGGVAIGASTITSVFTATLRISQAVYELKAVGEQTRDLLDTTKHIEDSLRNVRIVRRQKSILLTTTEKEWIDGQIKNSEKAVNGVAALIEPARVDMQSKSNRTKDIRLKNRVMFVLRDSPNVTVQLTKLSIATQGLNAAMGVLCNREGHGSLAKLNGGTVKRSDRRSSSPYKKAPPTYELSEFMNRRRTTSSVPRRKDLHRKRSKVSFVDEDRSGDESATLSTGRSRATLRTKSSWATTEELVHSAEDGRADTEKEVLDSEISAYASKSGDAPYLDRFDKSPACIPLLTLGDSGIPIRADAHSAVPSDENYIDSWTLETLKALEEHQDVQTSTLRAHRSSDYLTPNSIQSASVVTLDSGIARITQTASYILDPLSDKQREEMLSSHPPLTSHESEPITSQMPGAYPSTGPPRPPSFQPQHAHSASMPSLPDGFARQSLVPAPLRTAIQSPPFHFLTPQTYSNENSKVETWGSSGPPKPAKPARLTSTSTIPHSARSEHSNTLPYPCSDPSTSEFQPLTQSLSDPLPQRPGSAHSPHCCPTPNMNAPSPAYPLMDANRDPPYRPATPSANSRPPLHSYWDSNQHSPHRALTPAANPRPPPPPLDLPTGPSLAETVQQDRALLFYKPLPDRPFGRNASITSVTPSIQSTKSEPATSNATSNSNPNPNPNPNGVSRMSRGRMWLEHQAERPVALSLSSPREPVGGLPRVGFLAPLPTKLTVREM